MFKKITLLIILLNLNNNADALNNIDKFILNHGVSACNGESPNCKDFYNKAVELNDDQSPTSPEIRF
jgi:hypothetical protein